MNMLIYLNEKNKKHVKDLSERCLINNNIILEEYIRVDDILALLEELYYELNKEDEYNEDMYIMCDEYDEVIEREILEG